MQNERQQYGGRRQINRQKSAKKNTYIKKFMKQTIISVLILGIFIVSGKSDSTIPVQIQKITKSAITYQIDSAQITKLLSKILKFVPRPYLTDTRENTNETDTNPEKTV